jgi:hypothetical protein
VGTSEFNSDFISIRNFWPGEDLTKKFLFSLIANTKKTSDKVIVTSVFPKKQSLAEKVRKSIKYRLFGLSDMEYVQKRSYGIEKPVAGKHIKNVWYTGENRRLPSDDGWDAFLSFELDRSFSKNIYLPIWVTRLGQNIEEVQSRIEKMVLIREPRISKTKFACAFVGNPEPKRMMFINEFSKYFKIDLFGSAFNNPIENKSKILDEYRFNICFENDLYPGYVTEKAFESWESEAIPIWWGLDEAKFLNPNSLIDVTVLGFDRAIDDVRKIASSEEKMYSLRSQPILLKRYDLINLVDKLKELLH